jgi:hypothetical protein
MNIDKPKDTTIDPNFQLHTQRGKRRLPYKVRQMLKNRGMISDKMVRWTFATSKERNEKATELHTAMGGGDKRYGITKYSDATGYVVAMPRMG